MHRLQVSTEVPQPLIIVNGNSSIVSNLVFPGWFIGRFVFFFRGIETYIAVSLFSFQLLPTNMLPHHKRYAGFSIMSAILTVVFDALMVVSFVSVEKVLGTILLRCPVALGDCIVESYQR
jgi:hypothetical protein